ncbi:MAG: hypothetical protein Q9222_005316 [Ikaeria aurantiellina]
MGHHSQFFGPSDTPDLQPGLYNHEVFRLRSGNEQSSRAVKPAVSPAVKAEKYEPEDIRRKPPNQSAQAAIKQQQQRKRQRKTDNRDILNFTAFRKDELNSTRYLQYRERSRQKIREGTAGEQVWDDVAEDAFQRGMQHVTAITDDSALRAAHQINIPDIDFDRLHDDQMDAILQSCYANVGHTGNGRELSLAVPPAYGILGSNVPEDRRPFINRIEFEMNVLSPAQKPFHSYTTNQADIGASPRALEDVCNWRTTFPGLDDYYEQGQLPSDIVLVESNLSFSNQFPPEKSTLSIRFNISLAGASGREEWLTKADYYENGHPLDMKKFDRMNNIRKDGEWESPNTSRCPGSSDVQLQIPLQSMWWVQLFTKIAARKLEMQRNPYLLQQEEEWSRRYLEELSIMQELCIANGTSRKRVAIILWKFSQARAGDAATTTWRRLRPPPQRFKVNSPNQSPTPLLQHSMVLDSTLQNIAMPQPVSVQAERFLHHSNMLIEDSLCGSPPSACSPAYTDSFPSSTSTSFPPSVTHGFLAHEDSQESAYYSQEGDPHRHGSFASQSSFTFAPEPTYTFKQPLAYDEGLAYPTDSPAVDSQDQAFYSQHSFDTISHVQFSAQYGDHSREPDVDDFSGGQIHLSFEPDLSSTLYHTPYMPSPSAVPPNREPALGTHSHLEEVEDPTIAHGFGGDGLDAPETSVQLHTRNDYSALESQCTAEELAAIRLHDAEYGYPNEHLHNDCEAHGFGRLRDAVREPGGQSTLRTDLDSGSVEIEHARKSTGLDEMEEEIIEVEEGNEADHGFEFEEIEYEEEDQGRDGQPQNIGGVGVGGGDDYEEDDFHEDHL